MAGSEEARVSSVEGLALSHSIDAEARRDLAAWLVRWKEELRWKLTD